MKKLKIHKLSKKKKIFLQIIANTIFIWYFGNIHNDFIAFDARRIFKSESQYELKWYPAGDCLILLILQAGNQKMYRPLTRCAGIQAE